MWSMLISMLPIVQGYIHILLFQNFHVGHSDSPFDSGALYSHTCASNPQTVTNCASTLCQENEAINYTKLPKYKTKIFFTNLSFKIVLGGHLTITYQNVQVLKAVVPVVLKTQ